MPDLTRTLSGPVLRARETTSAVPLYPALWGFGFLNMKRLEAIPLTLAWALEVRYPPQKRGISAMLARYRVKARPNVCNISCAMLSQKVFRNMGEHLALGRSKNKIVWVGFNFHPVGEIQSRPLEGNCHDDTLQYLATFRK